MATETAQNWAQVAQRTRRPVVEATPWSALERFMGELDAVEAPDRQTLLMLDAILELTGAEAVVLVPTREGEAAVSAGAFRPDEASARSLVAQLEAAALTESQCAASAFSRSLLARLFRGCTGPTPCDVTLVRIGQSRPAWLLAATYAPGRLLHPGSGGVIRLAARALRSRQKAARSTSDLTEALFGVVQGFSAVTDAKDPYTYGHSERVARMASRIGRQMRLPEGTASELYLAGLLHDIGKIGVPEAVLCKPGKLTPDESFAMQAHPAIGDRILSGIRQLAHVRTGVRSHHERFDGNGYPDKLAGERIPLLGRVLAVADTCDAMLSVRHYRPSREPAEVEAELMAGRGKQWDPTIVDAFFACREDIYTIRQVGLGASVQAAVHHAVEVTSGET